jgi:hypothetical protein
MVGSNKYPRSSAELANTAEAARTFILSGSVPSAPIFKRTDIFWTAGSCFAVNLAETLAAKGVPVWVQPLQETANSPPHVRSFLEHVAAEQEGPLFPRATIESAAKNLSTAQGAVLTFGLAAAAFDADGVVIGGNNPSQWRALSAAECQADIAAAIDVLRLLNPNIKIVLTVSPVPLNRPIWSGLSPMIADCVSKSTLRVAVDQYMRTAPKGVYYWPSFEMVRWLGAHKAGFYGADDDIHRHVSNSVVGLIVDLFFEHYISN